MKKFQLLSIFLTTLLLCSCGQLPENSPTTQLSQPRQPEASRLYKIVAPEIEKNNYNSGLHLLRDGKKALLERAHLADIAGQSIDLQYYIWNSDKSGKLLMQKLLMAAERGVFVRLLLDDFSIGDRNDELMVINSHPNIEVRIYNPFISRGGVGKWLNFALDFDRLNRRMHNKTYIVDDQVAITGGRNIGDEYFGFHDHLNFYDADVLSVGPVVSEIADSFSKYWQSEWAVQIDRLVTPDDDLQAETRTNEFLKKDFGSPLGLDRIMVTSDLGNHFKNLFINLLWAEAFFVADEPGGRDDDAYSGGPKRVAESLMELAGNSTEEILIESAYFVLSDAALELVGEVKAKGVTIRALTNSMSSNDVLPNHASYAKVRKAMLEHGIQIHELRPDAESCLHLIQHEDYCDNDSFVGLHAKAAVFDNETVYIGSLNFNLRSAYLNTEAAMIIKSTRLANQLAQQIELNMDSKSSWRVELQDGDLVWSTKENGEEKRSSVEPLTTWMERVKAGLFKILPGSLYY